MFFIILDRSNNAIGATTAASELQASKNYSCRTHDDFTYDNCRKWAQQLTQVKGRPYIVVDARHARHGVEVIEAPRVGDEVSFAFNGDYYPCGKISRISASMGRITTDTGEIFIRNRNTAQWTRKGGTWVLVRGHISRQNPEF